MSTLSQSFIGSYRLLAPIRTGRYTQVWSAINDVEHRYVAAKILLSDFWKDAEQLRTMRQELRIGRILQHPLCLGPFEMRSTKQGTFLLMELFRGDSLRDTLKKHRSFIHERLSSIVRQAAEGIAHLNTLGFLHLDVKPDNFLINDDGEVRLIDFGLARRLPNGWERVFWKTRQKLVQGTRSYVSPEMIRREPVDLRSDVYSFGCTLYHLAAGLPPFTGSSSEELLNKHLSAAPPKLLVENPDATPEFSDLVRRMMAKRRTDRPKSVGELLPELANLRLWKAEAAKESASAQVAG